MQNFPTLKEYSSDNYPIPQTLNIVIFFTALIFTWCMLFIASHFSFFYALLAAILFALTHNTIFSLLHEAVHGVFSPKKSINRVFGTLSAATFPTSYTMQKIAHLGHHKRNRTDKELYDYYLPNESKTLRNFWLYGGNLLGLYWFVIPLSNIIILIAPNLFTSKWFRVKIAKKIGFEHFVEEIANHSIVKIWFEALLAFCYQVAIIYFLDLSFFGWFLCHYFFAMHWSSLQYVDHARSPRSVVHGAWNLKVLPISRALSLNYHYHLAHHRYPLIPWIYLPKFVDKSEKQPSFWSIYFLLWREGVKLAPPMEN